MKISELKSIIKDLLVEEAVNSSTGRQEQLSKIYKYVKNPDTIDQLVCHWLTADKIRRRNYKTDFIVLLGTSPNMIYHSYLVDKDGRALINSGPYGNPDVTFNEHKITVIMKQHDYPIDYTYVEFLPVPELFEMFSDQMIEESVELEKSYVLGEDIELPEGVDADNVSDGYHTFQELYDFRKIYNAALFNEWASKDIFAVHKSRLHNDGELPFGKDNMFIVCAELPTGQISNHYDVADWDLFQCEETETALHEYDGHTAQDVLKRITRLIKGEY